jgi:hypothetical protein
MAIAFYSIYLPPTDKKGHDNVWFAQQVADRVNAVLAKGPPAGGIYHAEGPTNDGRWWAFDVWESEAQKHAFDQSILTPALDELGIKLSGTAVTLDVWWESNQVAQPQ